jgi:SAM-dependent methyltransferase
MSHVHERERAFHDTWASASDGDDIAIDAAFEHPAALENRHILSQMGPLNGLRVLDLGTGRGESAIYFAKHGARVTAVDISPEMVRVAERGAEEHGVRIHGIASPVEALDIDDGSQDVVYGANILHHVTDIDATLRESARVLAPGGRVFFWDPLAYNPVINVYRRMATKVRSDDEHPLTFEVLDTFRRHFTHVEHREFWLSTLALFLKYALVDRLNPNEVRYWKRIYLEDPVRLARWFAPLTKLDDRLLRLPLVRRCAWNIVVSGAKRP